MNRVNVLPIFSAPEEADCLKAVARALLAIRADGHTCIAIARLLDCSAKTVENASNERTGLQFTSIARLTFYYPAHAAPILALWSGGQEPPDSPLEEIATAQRVIDKAVLKLVKVAERIAA